MLETSERPGLDEQYLTATQTSNLSLDPDHRGAADHLIAAGLAGNRIGGLIKRLRAEWDRAPKPPPWTDEDVAARAETLPKRKDRPDVRRARAEIISAYALALRKAYMRLPGRAVTLTAMLGWAERRNVDPDLLSPALYHHLAPNCPACHGRGQVKLPDAPILGKQCEACRGEGKWPRPLGAHTIHEWMTRAEGRERSQRAGLLHGQTAAGDIPNAAGRIAGEIEPDESPEEVSRLAAAFRLR